MRVDGELSWIFSDQLGSTGITYKADGSGTSRQFYYPFGGIRNPGGGPVVDTDVGFTGQRLDETTGLMFYQARYYDPLTARFISADTMIPDPGNPQDFNRYTSVRNNPLGYTDPSGNDPCPGGEGGCYLPDRNVVLAPVFVDETVPANPESNAATVSVAEFKVPRFPERGTVRIKFFIATPTVPIGPTFLGWAAWRYVGDDGGFSPLSSASESRAAVELDFVSGVGRVFTNCTCNSNTGGCKDSLPISLDGVSDGMNGFEIGFGHGEVSAAWWIVNPDQPLGLDFSAEGWLVLSFTDDGLVNVRDLNWDGFPSKEAYQFTPGGGYRRIFLQGQGNPLISIPFG
jgi:RHS repeat-associated protein